jgi:hypothetical protein
MLWASSLCQILSQQYFMRENTRLYRDFFHRKFVVLFFCHSLLLFSYFNIISLYHSYFSCLSGANQPFLDYVKKPMGLVPVGGYKSTLSSSICNWNKKSTTVSWKHKVHIPRVQHCPHPLSIKPHLPPQPKEGNTLACGWGNGGVPIRTTARVQCSVPHHLQMDRILNITVQ